METATRAEGAGKRKGSYGYRKQDLGLRLKKIEGQVRGISRMVEQEQYCVDILVQIAAIQAALDKVTVGILEDHVRGCVAGAMGTDDARERLEELVEVIERFVALRH